MTVIWPVYMDSEKTCKEGRKIPLNDAISNPNLEELMSATKVLKLNPIKQADKKYPGEWYNARGRLLVESETLSKKEIISSISKEVKSQRAKRAEELKNKKKKKKKFRK